MPPPDAVGYELAQSGGVFAEAELAWLRRKVVLLMPVQADAKSDWEAGGWSVVVAEHEWAQQLADELARRTDQTDEHRGTQV